MFELELDDKYFVSGDKMNFTLHKIVDVTDKGTGEVTGQRTKDIGYFGSHLDHALKRYVSEKIREEDKLNINELVEVLHKLEEHIEKVVKKEKIVLMVKE